MGVKLLILLGLLIGVLYSIHLLVKDYQAITAPRLLRLLFKRDLHPQNYSKPNVRWRTILQHDPIQCARFLYCDIGARPTENAVSEGFAHMLTLEPREDDASSKEKFQEAFNYGRLFGEENCKKKYTLCPFQSALLFKLIHYLLKQ